MIGLLAGALQAVVWSASPQAAAFPASLRAPFTTGETWTICQGYNGAISHSGKPFLDLTINADGAGPSGCTGNVNGSAGRAIRSPAAGTLYRVTDALGGTCINLNGGGSMYLGHLVDRRANGAVAKGDVIGKVGRAGEVGNSGYAHVHLQAHSGAGCGSSPVVPFDDAHGARFDCAPNLTSNGSVNQWSGTRLAPCAKASPTPLLKFGGKARDYDGDGFDDVYWYAPGSGTDTLWFGTATRGSFASVRRSIGGTYRPIGGDFDGDGFEDVYFYAPGTADDTILFGTATRGSFTRVQREVNGTYVPITGDFDGDGFDDLYWYAPGTGTDTLWFGSATRGTFTSVRRSVTGTYRPVTGDFDGDGFDDVYWYAPGSARDTIWFGSATRGTFASVRRSVSGTYLPITGDFDDDGFDDVYWYAPGSGTDTLWFGSATRGSFASVRRSVSGTYRPVTGDFDGDGFDDVYWYAPGSGTDTLWFGTATRGSFASLRRSVSGTYVPIR